MNEPADPLREALEYCVEVFAARAGGISYGLAAMKIARAALATKPTETPAQTIEDVAQRLQARLDRGHPTESAGKSPEAAIENVRTWLYALVSEAEIYIPLIPFEKIVARIAETQRSSNANGSDEQTSPPVQPPAPEPLTLPACTCRKCGECLTRDKITAHDVNRAYREGWDAALASPSIAQRGADLTDAQRDEIDGALGIAAALSEYCRLNPRAFLMQQAEECIRALFAALALSPEFRPSPPSEPRG